MYINRLYSALSMTKDIAMGYADYYINTTPLMQYNNI